MTYKFGEDEAEDYLAILKNRVSEKEVGENISSLKAADRLSGIHGQQNTNSMIASLSKAFSEAGGSGMTSPAVNMAAQQNAILSEQAKEKPAARDGSLEKMLMQQTYGNIKDKRSMAHQSEENALKIRSTEEEGARDRANAVNLRNMIDSADRGAAHAQMSNERNKIKELNENELNKIKELNENERNKIKEQNEWDLKNPKATANTVLTANQILTRRGAYKADRDKTMEISSIVDDFLERNKEYIDSGRPIPGFEGGVSGLLAKGAYGLGVAPAVLEKERARNLAAAGQLAAAKNKFTNSARATDLDYARTLNANELGVGATSDSVMNAMRAAQKLKNNALKNAKIPYLDHPEVLSGWDDDSIGVAAPNPKVRSWGAFLKKHPGATKQDDDLRGVEWGD